MPSAILLSCWASVLSICRRYFDSFDSNHTEQQERGRDEDPRCHQLCFLFDNVVVPYMQKQIGVMHTCSQQVLWISQPFGTVPGGNGRQRSTFIFLSIDLVSPMNALTLVLIAQPQNTNESYRCSAKPFTYRCNALDLAEPEDAPYARNKHSTLAYRITHSLSQMSCGDDTAKVSDRIKCSREETR